MTDDIVRIWTEIRELVDTISPDIKKNVNGNASAGVRARKGLRTIKAKAAELTKLSLAISKSKSQDSEASE
jgi:hypothetical protein